MLADAGRSRTARVDELLELTGIPAAARKRAGEYSMGMRQRLGLAAALLGDPRVLVLDEPSNGLDPEGIRWLRGFLRHLSSEGKTILVSSHLLQEVEQTVDEVVIIANGRLVRAGTSRRAPGHARVPSCARRTPLGSPGPCASPTSRAHRARTAPSSPTRPTCGSSVTSRCARGCRSTAWQPQRADLEALFFELTEGTNRNEARWAVPPPSGMP